MFQILNGGFEATVSHQGTATVAQHCSTSSRLLSSSQLSSGSASAVRHKEGPLNLPLCFPASMPHLIVFH